MSLQGLTVGRERRWRANLTLGALASAAALAAIVGASQPGAIGLAAWILPQVQAAQITYVSRVLISSPTDGSTININSADVGNDDAYPLAVLVDTQTSVAEGDAGAQTVMEYYLTPKGELEPSDPTATSQTPPYSSTVVLPVPSRSRQFALRAVAVTGSKLRSEDTAVFTVNRLLSEVSLLAPVPASTIVVPPSTGSYRLTLRAETDFPADTAVVRYYLLGNATVPDTLLAEASNPANGFEAQYDLALPAGSEDFSIEFRLRADAVTKSVPTITVSRTIAFTVSTKEPEEPPDTTLAVTSPRQGEVLAVPELTEVVHVGFSVRPERAADVIQVDYYLDDAPTGAQIERLAAVATARPVFAAGAWAPVPSELNAMKLRAVATNVLQFEQAQGEAAFTFRKEPYQPDAMGPDQVPLDVVLAGESWYNVSPPPAVGVGDEMTRPEGGTRQTLATPLYPAKDGSTSRHTLADPYAPTRAVTVEAPSAVLNQGETGVLLFSVADTLEALLGSEAPVADEQTRGPLAAGGLYAQICVVVTTNGGATYYELPAERLSVAPITLHYGGLVDAASGDVALAKADSEPVTLTVAERPSLSFAVASDPVAWVRGTDNATAAEGSLTATLTSVSAVFAPVESPTLLPMCGAGGKFAYATVFLAISASAVRRRRR